jgi:hypothetical protein
VMGSAEPLASADVARHPERDSFVGWYLQVRVCVCVCVVSCLRCAHGVS